MIGSRIVGAVGDRWNWALYRLLRKLNYFFVTGSSSWVSVWLEHSVSHDADAAGRAGDATCVLVPRRVGDGIVLELDV